jgi:hypothetical protein
MPIQPNDMLPMSLPAAGWDWLMEVLPQLAVPMQPRDQIVAMLHGQMKAHLDRAAAADALAEQPATDEPAPPAPTRKRNRT